MTSQPLLHRILTIQNHDRDALPGGSRRASLFHIQLSSRSYHGCDRGKWKMIILWYVDESPRRFGELSRLIPNISDRVLFRQLKEMTEHELIERTIYPEVPPRVEYHITEFGQSLRPVINEICEWGEQHMERLNTRAEWVSRQLQDPDAASIE